jgi:hypothetical protein
VKQRHKQGAGCALRHKIAVRGMLMQAILLNLCPNARNYGANVVIRRNIILIKSFMAGIFLGIAACVSALYFAPIVDQHREVSMIVVNPNGRNAETFHVNVPMDRIMTGAPEQNTPVPTGLQWPNDERFSDIRAELFKIRNGKDTVVGVASRIAIGSDDSDSIVEWVLHLPARGSVYVSMRPGSVNGGYRVGELLGGTREFGSLQGPVSERWVADMSGLEGTPAGRIELQTEFEARAEL